MARANEKVINPKNDLDIILHPSWPRLIKCTNNLEVNFLSGQREEIEYLTTLDYWTLLVQISDLKV